MPQDGAAAMVKDDRVGRPKVPLIDRDAAIAKALEIIDAQGLDGFSIRGLGSELGVNGASLYHHFADKDEILHGVRLLVLREARVVPLSWKGTWQEHLTTSMSRYREALLRHPNTTPLMVPRGSQTGGLTLRERLMSKMVSEGVPSRFVHAIIDSAEMLVIGSTLFNPQQVPPRAHLNLAGRTDLPETERAARSAPRTAKKLFLLELEALLSGWSELVGRENARSVGT
jgi:AcrR family transcriptional regulator